MDVKSDLKFNIWMPSNKTIDFCYGSDGKIASLKTTGLVCEQDKLPNKTSDDFANMLLYCLINAVGKYDFKQKIPFKIMVDGEPVMAINQKYLTLSSTEEMTQFDVWVFDRLQDKWKSRKV